MSSENQEVNQKHLEKSNKEKRESFLLKHKDVIAVLANILNLVCAISAIWGIFLMLGDSKQTASSTTQLFKNMTKIQDSVRKSNVSLETQIQRMDEHQKILLDQQQSLKTQLNIMKGDHLLLQSQIVILQNQFDLYQEEIIRKPHIQIFFDTGKEFITEKIFRPFWQENSAYSEPINLQLNVVNNGQRAAKNVLLLFRIPSPLKVSTQLSHEVKEDETIVTWMPHTDTGELLTLTMGQVYDLNQSIKVEFPRGVNIKHIIHYQVTAEGMDIYESFVTATVQD